MAIVAVSEMTKEDLLNLDNVICRMFNENMDKSSGVSQNEVIRVVKSAIRGNVKEHVQAWFNNRRKAGDIVNIYDGYKATRVLRSEMSKLLKGEGDPVSCTKWFD